MIIFFSYPKNLSNRNGVVYRSSKKHFCFFFNLNLNLFFPFTQPFIALLLYSWVGRGARTNMGVTALPVVEERRKKKRKKERKGREKKERGCNSGYLIMQLLRSRFLSAIHMQHCRFLQVFLALFSVKSFFRSFFRWCSFLEFRN